MTRKLRAVAAFLVTTAVACDAPTAARPAFAYDPTSLSNGQVYRWSLSSEISVHAAPGGVAQHELSDAVSKAIAAWNDVRRFNEFELVTEASARAADIVVYDRSAPNPLRPGNCTFDPRGSGYTYFCVTSFGVEMLLAANGETTDARILISVDRGAVSSRQEYEAVVAHELGHALGIGGHSPDQGDLMYGDPRVSKPSSRDRQTLHYVLGAEPAFVFF